MKLTFPGILTSMAVLVALVSSPSAAEQGRLIQIDRPWARASIIKSRPAAVFMTIVNLGNKADRLVSVSSSMAEKVSVHLSEMKNGVIQMNPMHDLPLEAGEKVTLKPGGLHLMLMKLKAPLKKGKRLALTLKFEVAGKIDVQVPIFGLGAKGPE